REKKIKGRGKRGARRGWKVQNKSGRLQSTEAHTGVCSRVLCFAQYQASLADRKTSCSCPWVGIPCRVAWVGCRGTGAETNPFPFPYPCLLASGGGASWVARSCP